VLVTMAVSGIPLGDGVVDSAYAHRAPEHFALPLRAAGPTLVMDLHAYDRDTQGTFSWSHLVQRQPLLPGHPQDPLRHRPSLPGGRARRRPWPTTSATKSSAATRSAASAQMTKMATTASPTRRWRAGDAVHCESLPCPPPSIIPRSSARLSTCPSAAPRSPSPRGARGTRRPPSATTTPQKAWRRSKARRSAAEHSKRAHLRTPPPSTSPGVLPDDGSHSDEPVLDLRTRHAQPAGRRRIRSEPA